MAINSPKNILKKYNLEPTKYLGQNFLIDKNVLREIIKTADIKPSNTILEIGPGLGVLTKELAKKAGKVIAVEKDPQMVKILNENLKEFSNVKIIQADILKSNIQNLISNIYYKVVANLPYYITSPVIRKFLESENKPKLMVLMVQKEVSQRICEKSPHMSILSVSVQFYAKPEIIKYVSKKSFWPAPKVDSAIIKIFPRQFRVPVPRRFREQFFRIVKAGFSQPRKQLANNLMKGLAPSLSKGLALSLSKGVKLNKNRVIKWLALNKIKPEQRAETLSINDWKNLTRTIRFRI